MKVILLIVFATALLIYIGLRLYEFYRVKRRESIEDVLKYLFTCQEEGITVSDESIAGLLKVSRKNASRLLDHLGKRGLIRKSGERILLTPSGQAWGLQILRAHRLWERYLADDTKVPLKDIHRLADKEEHRLTSEEIKALEERLGYPPRDPHGDPIPTEKGVMFEEIGTPLPDWPLNKAARVAHIEDEPEAVFTQILAEGLLPGTDLIVKDISPSGVRIEFEGNDLWLAPVVASNIYVLPAPKKEKEFKGKDTLALLQPGEKGRVLGISDDIRGLARRRLLDLGFTKGALVEATLKGSFGGGDPTAFRVRGTVMALRKEEAQKIFIERISKDTKR